MINWNAQVRVAPIMTFTRRELLAGMLLGSITGELHADDNRFGHFSGQIKTRWLQDGRLMELLAPLLYTDPDGVQWYAPAGSRTDGASIPKFAWSFIGGPFEGRYRDAAVIHDVACDQKHRYWESVHLAFYNAMRCREVETWRAKVMYAAVYHFGPRWLLNVTEELPKKLFATEAEFFELAASIESGETKRPPKHTAEILLASCTESSGSNVFDMVQAAQQRAMCEVAKAIAQINGSQLGRSAVSLSEIRSFAPTPIK